MTRANSGAVMSSLLKNTKVYKGGYQEHKTKNHA